MPTTLDTKLNKRLLLLIITQLGKYKVKRAYFVWRRKGLTLKNAGTDSTTFIGEGALFKGLLAFEGTVCIDGKFEGQVDTSGTLIISEAGAITADIEAGIVICKGQVKGNVTATQKVEMHPSSKITGNVKSPSLSIEIGAKVEGSIDMSNKITASKISLDAP